MSFWTKKPSFHHETDVVVIGSGGAGLAAALAAHANSPEGGKSKVTILEKSALVGGTTAVSGGVVWVPNNHHMKDVGIADSRDEAVGYVERLADGRSDRAMIEAFVDAAPKMLRFVEGAAGIPFTAIEKYPDYWPELPGGRPGGRSLDPGLFDSNELGEWKKKLRRSAIFGMTAMSVTEATEWGVFSKPLKLPFKLLGERFAKGLVCYGGALVGRLLKAVLARGIEPQLSIGAKDLIVEDGRVIGVRADKGGAEYLIRAKKAVVLASGGFEWNKSLSAQFLGGPLTHPNSPPSNTGDGLRMAMSLGADLGNMTEAWWCPSISIPGEEYDGHPLHRGDFAIRSLPHSIIVNAAGKRFVNEARNYNDLMKPFAAFDPTGYARPNLPAWVVFDASFVEKYAVMTHMPGREPPSWITRADTLKELAAKIGVDPHGLTSTVERFNVFAAEGRDKDFARGDSLYDKFYGDPEQQPNPNLGPIAKGPFFALQVHPGAIGTKGGAKVNARAQVMSVEGNPIPGLYAAGNVAAGVTGAGYPGAGATISAAMTFGYLAGTDAASLKTT